MHALLRLRGLLYFVVLGAVLAIVSFSRKIERERPVAPSSASSGWADEQLCAECHFEIAEQFGSTGHAQTLQRASESESLGLLRRLSETAADKDEEFSLELDDGGIRALHRTGNSERTLELEWCFGSGNHARTWVGTIPGGRGERDLVEFRWTWFHQLGDFGITPGQPKSGGSGYYASLGMLFDAPKARRCFACHATVLPEDPGFTDYESVHPGVTCQRCHGPRQRHVESEGEIQEGFWRSASRMASINRCGECHRIADDQSPEEIDPNNRDIIRFQPVGLVQSPCFRGSKEMTCMTCHDPHKPLAAQDSRGIWQCVQCHDGTEDALCAAGHADDCLTCHMPRVRSLDTIEFTDHWIRIREPLDVADP